MVGFAMVKLSERRWGSSQLDLIGTTEVARIIKGNLSQNNQNEFLTDGLDLDIYSD